MPPGVNMRSRSFARPVISRFSPREPGHLRMDTFLPYVGRFCVSFVWAISTIYYCATWQYIFIPFMMYTGHPLHTLILVVFHALFVLFLYSYFLASNYDPGYVPHNYVRALSTTTVVRSDPTPVPSLADAA